MSLAILSAAGQRFLDHGRRRLGAQGDICLERRREDRAVIPPPEDLVQRVRRRAEDPQTRTDMAPLGELPAVISETTLADAERELGFALPAQLSYLYLRVANGGFGPGYGLVGVHQDLHGFSAFGGARSIERHYEAIRGEWNEEFHWPERIVPICDWGCGIWSCVDCDEADSPVVRFYADAATDNLGPSPFGREAPSLLEWLADWASGVSLWDREADGIWLPNR